MHHFLIGIAGGSGCGKSTLSYELRDKYPKLIEAVHFDDYQKEKLNVPLFEGMRNWDHPDAIDFAKLHHDLLQLKGDREVKLMTKDSLLNPTYEKKGRIPHILKPKKIIIVEGYLLFKNEEVRNLFDLKIFLDIPIMESMKRRTKITCDDESEYNNRILIPMHEKYVEPSKNIADLSIDVLKNNKNDVYDIIVSKLNKLKLLPL